MEALCHFIIIYNTQTYQRGGNALAFNTTSMSHLPMGIVLHKLVPPGPEAIFPHECIILTLMAILAAISCGYITDTLTHPCDGTPPTPTPTQEAGRAPPRAHLPTLGVHTGVGHTRDPRGIQAIKMHQTLAAYALNSTQRGRENCEGNH